MKKFNFIDIQKYRDFPLHIDRSLVEGSFIVHTHDFSELVVVIEGNAVQIIDGVEYNIEAGDVYVISGDTSHGFKDAHGLVIYNIMFDPGQIFRGNDSLKQLTGFQALFVLEPYYRKEQQFKSKLRLNIKNLNFVDTLAQKMMDEYTSSMEGFKDIIKMYFISLAAFLSREYSENIGIASEQLFNTAKAVAYMEKNFSQRITMEDLASIACLSTRHFSRIFKLNYNISPIDYVIQLRLQQALKLIRNTGLPITQVALESGFNDSNYFCRLFKLNFGISPTVYRKYPNKIQKQIEPL